MDFDSFLQVGKTGAFGVLIHVIQTEVGYAHVWEMYTYKKSKRDNRRTITACNYQPGLLLCLLRTVLGHPITSFFVDCKVLNEQLLILLVREIPSLSHLVDHGELPLTWGGGGEGEELVSDIPQPLIRRQTIGKHSQNVYAKRLEYVAPYHILTGTIYHILTSTNTSHTP